MRSFRARPSRVVSALAALTAGALVTSCASLPTDSAPQVIRSFDAPTQVNPDITPAPDSDPDVLLRDFFAASAVPAGNYEGAKSFLSDAARQAWDPSASTIVVDRISVNTLASGGDTQSFNVQGNVIGELRPGGSFIPARQGYEATMEVQRVDGQWRISSLPTGAVIERTEMRNRYQPFNLYFFNRDGTQLVPDRRWVFVERDTLETTLITLLLRGPSERVRTALKFDLPAEAAYTGVEDGAYTFTGLSGLGEQERLRFAAQLVWTLAGAGVSGPIAIYADGDPLLPGTESFSREDFPNVSPTATVEEERLYTLAGGRLFEVAEEKAQPMDGRVAGQGNIVAADVTAAGDYAIITGAEGDQVFRAGAFEQGAREILRGDNFTRPTFESSGSGIWTVMNGRQVQRAVRAPSGEYSTAEVVVELPQGVDGSISVLRLSNTGVRAVMVIEGTLYTGIVEQYGDGERRVINVLEYAPDLAGSVISADWQPDGSIIAGTSNPGSPVVRVEQDGSGTTGKPIGNITAPVVAVAAGVDMIYATDANAVLQIPAGVTDVPNWREVPGLQGVRSVPIVAH
ncbi:LpqB family beta-propeller domain-containing protein [Corynebacterium sanguinis]